MESKKDKAIRLLNVNKQFLKCPVCGEKLDTDPDDTLKCVNGHNFDISRKGTVNLTGGSNDKIYNDILFRNRRKVIGSGYYDVLIYTLAGIITEYKAPAYNEIAILDAGCGEGSFLHRICSELFIENTHGLKAGIDLSRSGVNMATDHLSDVLWIIDDLAGLHINDHTFDVILDILSPANHNEFKRVLKKNGIIIKVIPGKNYLTEIRDIITQDPEEKSYNNSETIRHTEKWMEIDERKKIEYTIDPDRDDLNAFIKMTPMTHGKAVADSIKKVHGLTIDLEIIIGRPR